MAFGFAMHLTRPALISYGWSRLKGCVWEDNPSCHELARR